MKMLFKPVCLWASCLFSLPGIAQNVAINEDGSPPDRNAILDVKSFNKGVLIPRLGTAGRLAIPNTKGLLVYDTANNSFWYNTGTGWQPLDSDTAAWSLTGNGGAGKRPVLGTINAAPLNIRVNSQPAGIIDPGPGNTFWGYQSGRAASLQPGQGLFNTGLGAQSLSSNTTGSDNSALDTASLQVNTSASNNTAAGARALANNNGENNTAIGNDALNKNTTGANNTAVGLLALFNNSTGSDNTATGLSTMYSNTTGNFNVADGVSALYSNTTGGNNVAVGHNALFYNDIASNNTACGASALVVNTGIANTATGAFALFAGTKQSNNTAAGYSAIKNTLGSGNNVAIGANTLLNEYISPDGIHGSQNVAVGVNAISHGGDWNVACGANAMMDAMGSGVNTALGLNAMLSIGKNGLSSVYNVAAGALSMQQASRGGNTCIGYAADMTDEGMSNTVSIGAGAMARLSNQVMIGHSATSAIEGQVPFTTPSDARFKYNVQKDVKGLDFIRRLRAVTYRFDAQGFDAWQQPAKPDSFKARFHNAAISLASYITASQVRRSGFLAQEVVTAAREAGYDFSGINQPQSEKDPYSLSYDLFVVPLVKAAQELNQKAERLQKQNDLLRQRVAEIRKLVKAAQ